MKRPILALLILSILPLAAHSQTSQPTPSKRAKVKVLPAQNVIESDEPVPGSFPSSAQNSVKAKTVATPSSLPASSGRQKIAGPTTAVAAPVAPAPVAPPPTPWKLSYLLEYYGPRFGSALNSTQGPYDNGSYGFLDHNAKFGFAVNETFTFGTQVRARNSFDPSRQFFFKNLRFYGAWNHMIENSVIDMKGVLDVELPTQDSARENGMLVAFNIKNFWTFKTELRNWSFSALTFLRPTFYNNPTDNTDLYVLICPNATVDLFPNWQWQFDGNFDASHTYSASYFDYGPDDPDYVDIGPIWSINDHFQFTPNLRFYTANLSFSTATAYITFSAAL